MLVKPNYAENYTSIIGKGLALNVAITGVSFKSSD
jgi:hypothetical protein